jgi:crotonobetainyl-CoA:carnitine CoA-transferase CaiB-like acyl-CoA transferase
LFLGTTPDRWPEVANAFDTAANSADDDQLEVFVEKAIAALSVVEAVSRLQQAGVGAHEVVPVAALMGPDGPAAQRGLRLEEHSDRFGRVVMAGPVIRLHRTPLRPGRLPAAFGSEQDTVWGQGTVGAP